MMNKEEWLERCAERLHERWPRVPREQLTEVALEIKQNALRQLEEPEHAAIEWLSHGIPNARD